MFGDEYTATAEDRDDRRHATAWSFSALTVMSATFARMLMGATSPLLLIGFLAPVLMLWRAAILLFRDNGSGGRPPRGSGGGGWGGGPGDDDDPVKPAPDGSPDEGLQLDWDEVDNFRREHDAQPVG